MTVIDCDNTSPFQTCEHWLWRSKIGDFDRVVMAWSTKLFFERSFEHLVGSSNRYYRNYEDRSLLISIDVFELIIERRILERSLWVFIQAHSNCDKVILQHDKTRPRVAKFIKFFMETHVFTRNNLLQLSVVHFNVNGDSFRGDSLFF